MFRHTFPKSLRILKRADFKDVERGSARFYSRYFIVCAKCNDLDHPRLGMTVTKKIGSSPIRHWWKRRIREIFRLHKESFCLSPEALSSTELIGLDVVVIVKRPKSDQSGEEASRPSYQVLEQDLLWAIEQVVLKIEAKQKSLKKRVA